MTSTIEEKQILVQLSWIGARMEMCKDLWLDDRTVLSFAVVVALRQYTVIKNPKIHRVKTYDLVCSQLP